MKSVKVDYVAGTAARKLQSEVYIDSQSSDIKPKPTLHTIKNKVNLILAILIIAVLSCFCVIRYIQITELNYSISKYHKQHENLVNENNRLKVVIESQANLGQIRLVAEDKLGMTIPDKQQIVYVKIPKINFTTRG